MHRKKGSRLRRKFLPGEALVKEGEISGWAYLILSGRVCVTKKAHGQNLVLAELGPNDLVGEMSIVDQKPRSATVTAIVETDALMLNLSNLRDVMHDSPETAIVVFRALANKLRVANEKLLRRYSPEEIGFWHQLLVVVKLWVDASTARPSARKLDSLKETLHDVFSIDQAEAHDLICRMIAAQILTDPAETKDFTICPRRLNQFMEAYDLIHAQQETEDKLTLADFDLSMYILGVVGQKLGEIPDSQVVMSIPELKEAVLSTDLWQDYPQAGRERLWDESVARLTKHGLLGVQSTQPAEIVVRVKEIRNLLALGLQQGGAFHKACEILTGRKQ